MESDYYFYTKVLKFSVRVLSPEIKLNEEPLPVHKKKKVEVVGHIMESTISNWSMIRSHRNCSTKNSRKAVLVSTKALFKQFSHEKHLSYL